MDLTQNEYSRNNGALLVQYIHCFNATVMRRPHSSPALLRDLPHTSHVLTLTLYSSRLS